MIRPLAAIIASARAQNTSEQQEQRGGKSDPTVPLTPEAGVESTGHFGAPRIASRANSGANCGIVDPSQMSCGTVPRTFTHESPNA
jgi:hypothetical protein